MLTAPQKTIIKNYIDNDPTLSAIPKNSDGAFAIAAMLNLPAEPAFIVWKSRVTQDEIMQNGFDWSRVNNLSVGKARTWEWLFGNEQKTINPSKANIRSGIDDAWVGTAADLAVRAAVYAHCKRGATVFEKLLATGTGTDAVPATIGAESPVSYQDIETVFAV